MEQGGAGLLVPPGDATAFGDAQRLGGRFDRRLRIEQRPQIMARFVTALGRCIGAVEGELSKAKSQGVHKDATALLTACGLALRSFD